MLGILDIVYTKHNNSVQPQKGEYCMCMHPSVPVRERKSIVLKGMKFTSTSTSLQKSFTAVCRTVLTYIKYWGVLPKVGDMSKGTSLATLGLLLTISLEQQKIMQVGTSYRASLCSKCYRESVERCAHKGSVQNHGSHRPEQGLVQSVSKSKSVFWWCWHRWVLCYFRPPLSSF